MFRSTSKRATNKNTPPEQSLQEFFDSFKPTIPFVWDGVERSDREGMEKFAEERVLKRLGYTEPASDQVRWELLSEIMWEKSTDEFQYEWRKEWRRKNLALGQEYFDRVKEKAATVLVEQQKKRAGSKPRWWPISAKVRKCSAELYCAELSEVGTPYVDFEVMNEIAQKMTRVVLHSRAFERAWADSLRPFKELGSYFFTAVSILAFLGVVSLTLTIIGRVWEALEANPVVGAILALASSGFVSFVIALVATWPIAWLVDKSANETLWVKALFVFGCVIFAFTWAFFLIKMYTNWL